MSERIEDADPVVPYRVAYVGDLIQRIDHLTATLRAEEAERDRLRGSHFSLCNEFLLLLDGVRPVCLHCLKNRAVCFGESEGVWAFSCDECCGHGNEDMRCSALANTAHVAGEDGT